MHVIRDLKRLPRLNLNCLYNIGSQACIVSKMMEQDGCISVRSWLQLQGYHKSIMVVLAMVVARQFE